MSDAAAVAEEVREPSRPSVVRRTLHLLITPSPGRLRNTLIQVGTVLVVAVIWEVFRIPETSTACYFMLFTNRNNRTATGAAALGVAVLGPVAMLLAIGMLMVGLSEPALRIGLMALFSFVAMYLSRASTAGTDLLDVERRGNKAKPGRRHRRAPWSAARQTSVGDLSVCPRSC